MLEKEFFKVSYTTGTAMSISSICFLLGLRVHFSAQTEVASSVFLCVRISVTSQVQLEAIKSCFFLGVNDTLLKNLFYPCLYKLFNPSFLL